MTRPALDMVAKNWAVWHNIVLGGGDSPASPGFTAVSTYADDLLWGIFMANLQVSYRPPSACGGLAGDLTEPRLLCLPSGPHCLPRRLVGGPGGRQVGDHRL
jgi:hypothetical protein